MPKFFWGGGTAQGDTPSPDPTPVDAFGVSIRVPSALDPPDHISGYGPVSVRPSVTLVLCGLGWVSTQLISLGSLLGAEPQRR